MRKTQIALLVSILLSATTLYAGNGDLLVDGKLGVKTASPVSPLSLGNYISGNQFSTLYGSQVQINDAPSQTSSGTQTSLYLINQPNVAGSSSAANLGALINVTIPATAWNYFYTAGSRIQSAMYGTGTLSGQYGSVNFSSNQSTGTVTTQSSIYGSSMNSSGGSVTNQYGATLYTNNSSTGSVSTQYGALVRGQNTGTGTVGTSYGTYVDVNNSSTGNITTAYGLAIGDPTRPAINNPTGTVTNGYGLYLGNVQATNKWSFYAADATAPSYFAGKVGIGTTAPSYSLDVKGQVAATGLIMTSDAKFKKNLTSINSPLNKILKLNGQSYEWKTDEYHNMHFGEGRHYGFIAQEIEKVMPEVVKELNDGTKGIAYVEIIPVLIEAIKEQQKAIKEQKKDIEEQQKEIEELKKTIAASH